MIGASFRTLPITRLRAGSLDIDRKEVTWEVDNTQEDALDYTFQVLRSESPEGPFDAVTAAFEDRYLFVDANIPVGDKFRQLWYKLRVTHKESGDVRDFGPVTQEAEPDLIAQYIRRAQLTLLTRVIGRKVWLFKKRTFGSRCSSCWDTTSSKRTRSNCLTCYDTGFLRGYLAPIEIWVQVDPSAKSQQNQAMQIDQQVLTSARTSFYPNVNPGDVVVEAENKRWRVIEVMQSERLRATIKQELSMRQIQATDIEYKLPINLGEAITDVQVSPQWTFTNPHNLDNY